MEDIQNRIKKLLPEIGDNTKVKYLHNEYDKDYLYNIIYGYIEDIIEIGVTTIYEPALPVPDINLEEINDKIIKMGGEFLLKDICIAQYSNAQLKKYIEKFFELYIKEYNKIVEICLPGMKNNLSLYKAQPFHLIIEYNRFKQNNFTLTYGYNKNKTDENIFEVYINPDNSLFNQRGKIFNRIYFSTIERIFLNNIYYLVSSF